MLVLIPLGSCERQTAEVINDCSARPDGFQSESELLEGLDRVPDDVGNRISVRSNGSIEWNGYRVSTVEADELLRQVAAQNAATRAYLNFEWENGAPCDAVDQARQLIDQHMQCATSGMCIEGPVSRLYPDPPDPDPTDPRP